MIGIWNTTRTRNMFWFSRRSPILEPESEPGSRADSISVCESTCSDTSPRLLSFSSFFGSPARSTRSSSQPPMKGKRSSQASTISLTSANAEDILNGREHVNDLFSASPSTRTSAFDALAYQKMERTLSDRCARDRLVEALLSSHSHSVLIVRFLTAVNELLSTEDSKEWSRKAGKIIACFIRSNARYPIHIPQGYAKDLKRKRTRAFVKVRRYFIIELSLDPAVMLCLASVAPD